MSTSKAPHPPTTITQQGKVWSQTRAGASTYQRLWATGHGSARYGACMVCGKHVDTMWCADFAVAYRIDTIDVTNGVGMNDAWSLTQSGAPGSIWGHHACINAC